MGFNDGISWDFMGINSDIVPYVGIYKQQDLSEMEDVLMFLWVMFTGQNWGW